MSDLASHGVVAVIRNDRDEYLLLEDSRDHMLGYWAPPHGRCELDDGSEENSVIREVKEEVGLIANPIKKLFTQPADTKTLTVSFWLTEVESGEIQLDTSESSQYGWFSLEKALKLKLYPGTVIFFNKVKAGEIHL